MPDTAKATISATEVRIMASRIVKQKYSVAIALPYSYTTKPKQKYPTIYLTDADVYFGMVTEITRAMTWCGNFPETIVVGIGYPETIGVSSEVALFQFWASRARDLSPIIDRKTEKEIEADTKIKPVRTGGASKFLAFIKKELIPSIELAYRANPNHRVLAGHSFGGLFTLYALFHQPHLFTSYVSVSPSLGYGQDFIFALENDFAKRHKKLSAKLYLGVGGREEDVRFQMVSNVYRFAARMNKYKGLSLTTQIMENCDHCAVPAPAFQAGLRAVVV